MIHFYINGYKKTVYLDLISCYNEQVPAHL